MVCIATNQAGNTSQEFVSSGKLYRKKLKADDLALANASCGTSRDDLESTDATKGNTSFATVLDDYSKTLTGAETTMENKLAIVAKLKQTLFGGDTLPLRS